MGKTGYSKEELNARYYQGFADGVKNIEAKYKDLEEQGLLLLLLLPCKVGDTVWFIGNKFVNDYEVRRFIIGETGIDAIQVAKTIDGTDYWNCFSIDEIGKTVFLTKDEAEQKLKEMEGSYE